MEEGDGRKGRGGEAVREVGLALGGRRPMGCVCVSVCRMVVPCVLVRWVRMTVHGVLVPVGCVSVSCVYLLVTVYVCCACVWLVTGPLRQGRAPGPVSGFLLASGRACP